MRLGYVRNELVLLCLINRFVIVKEILVSFRDSVGKLDQYVFLENGKLFAYFYRIALLGKMKYICDVNNTKRK